MLAFLRRYSAALMWPGFALAAVLFYSIPLFSPKTTIHWDLADVFYPTQKFLADSLHSWKLPHWTPYLDSGIPFLADPRTGAWYPLHWPFFLIGITPRAMVWELVLHAFLAFSGAYLLARRLFDAKGPAILGGLLYAFGGFFVAHSTVLPGFECATLLPWLLWCGLRALEPGSLRWTAMTSLIGGLMVLTGDAPSALESMLALICVGTAVTYSSRLSWKRLIALVASVAIFALLAGAIQVLPAIELHSQSHPAQSSARFHFSAFATLISADYYSLISGLYTGPDDPRQYYVYSGLLLIPLAISGFARRERWLVLLAMIAPTVIFDAALRPPGDAWFCAGLGLAMAAASGAMWVEQRMERPHLWLALAALTAIDLWFWNVYKNPLVFAHATFAEVYGKTPAAQPERPLSRTWAPYVPVGSGPADGSLIARMEVTYGSGLADLDRYAAYLAAAPKYPRLLNGLAVTELVLGRNQRIDNPNALNRVTAPAHVDFVPDRKSALDRLASLDPASSTVVEAPARSVSPAQSIDIEGYTGDSYKVRYSAADGSLLRFAVPFYPGWTATVDGVEVPAFPADEALIGVFVPAGNHELSLRYHSRWFGIGAVLSGISATALVLIAILA